MLLVMVMKVMMVRCMMMIAVDGDDTDDVYVFEVGWTALFISIDTYLSVYLSSGEQFVSLGSLLLTM